MEQATLAKIATESLKPVSSIIDALLSAKLERIKLWAKKKENIDKLNHYQTNILLNNYLERLLRRVCGLATIVFPQQILPLTSIYEPLSLCGKFDLSEEEKNQIFGAAAIKEGCNYLIVDSAGMGKSTFVKHLALEIISSTVKIPIFLELRRIGDAESLLQRISRDIDDTQQDIDETILQMLLDQGGFVIILDGYDELPDQFRKKIGEQIAELSIRCNQNSLILTARPEVNLPEIPDSKVFTINPLSRKQAESLALRYDTWANIDVGKRLVAHFDSVLENFLQTPLFVALLYRTYGFNQSIATKITTFYDEIYNALYKGHDLTKSSFAREKSSKLDVEDFRRLLRCFSFLLAVRQKNNLKSKTEGVAIIAEAVALSFVQPASADAFFDDLLLAVPLFVRDGTDFRFIHKSLGEFFAAEFLAFTNNSDEIISTIRDGDVYDSFIDTFQYLSDINPGLFRKLIAFPLAKEILDEKHPVNDPILRSVLFWGKTRIGLWPYDKYTKKGKYHNTLFVTNEMSTTYFYGTLKARKFILAIQRTSERKMPYAAWKLISKETEISDITNMYHSDINFNKLGRIIPKEKWISLRTIRFSRKEEYYDLFENLLMRTFFLDVGTNRVLDDDVCRNLLEQVKQEETAQKLLASLLTKK